jgi:hypothetical protein
MTMTRLIFLLLQIYIVVGIIHDVGAQYSYQKRSASIKMIMEASKNIAKRAAQTSTSDTALCYDANNKNHIRLWNGRAPGAVGDNVCKDIPFLRVFFPNESAPSTDVGIVLMPGGGYDRLTDLKEQTPVAQYFANTIGKQTS